MYRCFIIICFLVTIVIGCSSGREEAAVNRRFEDYAKLPDTNKKPSWHQEKPDLPPSTLYGMWLERLKKEPVDTIKCDEVHTTGCHAGGPGSISCSISPGYYICLGTVASGGSVSCYEGYYACCGTYCYCEKNGRPGKAAPTKLRARKE